MIINKYITTQGFVKKLTSENFAARTNQANLACKTDIPDITDFYHKLKILNKEVTSKGG